MELHPVSADDPTQLRALRDAINDTVLSDTPWRHAETDHSIERELRFSFDGEPGAWFLVGDEPADPDGHLALFTTDYDNPEVAWLWLGIRPTRRREGRGRAALDLAFDVCRRLGRPLVGIDGWEGAATPAFAASGGFEQKSRTICRRLHLHELDRAAVLEQAAAAAAYAGDYELLRFTGAVPEELLGPVAALTESINDAPLDDLELEDEKFPVERIRAYEQAQAAGGWVLRRLVARHRETGELAGHTVAAVDLERPEIGDQHDTAVARGHRGHRLGMLMKAEMVSWLAEEEPQVATLDTYNAESNRHMVAVNEALGYRVMGRQLEFQRRI